MEAPRATAGPKTVKTKDVAGTTKNSHNYFLKAKQKKSLQ